MLSGATLTAKKGIGCGLNGVQKVRDGEPLGSRVTAQDAFQALTPVADPGAVPFAPPYATAPAPAPQPAPSYDPQSVNIFGF